MSENYLTPSKEGNTFADPEAHERREQIERELNAAAGLRQSLLGHDANGNRIYKAVVAPDGNWSVICPYCLEHHAHAELGLTEASCGGGPYVVSEGPTQEELKARDAALRKSFWI